MKTILRFFLFLMITGYPAVALFAQQEILSTGFEASGTGGSVSGSAGQVAFSTWQDTTGIITEGVQQPFEIFILSVNELESTPMCTVFPNPTSGEVTLKFNSSVSNMSTCLYDLNGTKLKSTTIDTLETIVPMDELQPATYILVILQKDQPVKTYKIIKR